MGIDFRVNVDNEGVAEKIGRKIEAGIRDASDELTEGIEREARGTIKKHNAVWTGELLSGFRDATVSLSGRRRVTVFNVAEHAPYQEEGVSGTRKARDTPYRYSDKKPPIDDLLPWVLDNLAGTGFFPQATSPGGARTAADDYPGVSQHALDLAFWLQDHLYREGIEGIHFMEDARLWAERNAADVTAGEISKHLRRL